MGVYLRCVSRERGLKMAMDLLSTALDDSDLDRNRQLIQDAYEFVHVGLEGGLYTNDLAERDYEDERGRLQRYARMFGDE